MISIIKPIRFLGRQASRSVAAVVVGVVALSGTAYASHELIFSSDIVDGQVFSVDVRDSSLTGTDVLNGSLTGSDINEASLDFGPSGIRCKSGTVQGFARVKGDVSSFPSIYTTSSSYVDIRRNCSGGTVAVRKASTGVFYVRFSGVPSVLALATSNADGYGTDSVMNDNMTTVARVTDTDGLPAFRVEVEDACDCGNGSVAQNGRFTILLL